MSVKDEDDLDFDPAFPNTINYTQYPGLSKREWFAGLAMQGMLAYGPESDASYLARNSILYADALIKELERG